MTKNGHTNAAYVSDVSDKTPKKYSLELAEKGDKYVVTSNNDSDDYDPYKNREVEHPTT